MFQSKVYFSASVFYFCFQSTPENVRAEKDRYGRGKFSQIFLSFSEDLVHILSRSLKTIVKIYFPLNFHYIFVSNVIFVSCVTIYPTIGCFLQATRS